VAPERPLFGWRAWWLYVTLVAALFVASLFLPDGGAMPGVTDADLRKEVIGYLTQMNQLVMALNTSLFAASGALAIKGRDWSDAWGTLETYLVMLALFGGACSYYGLFLTHTAVLERLVVGSVDLLDPRLQSALTIQYYGLLFGVVALGLTFVRLLEGRRPSGAAIAPTTPANRAPVDAKDKP
jgi:hypothetical protein